MNLLVRNSFDLEVCVERCCGEEILVLRKCFHSGVYIIDSLDRSSSLVWSTASSDMRQDLEKEENLMKLLIVA